MKNDETNPVHEFLERAFRAGHRLACKQAIEGIRTGAPPDLEFLERGKREFSSGLGHIISEYQEYEKQRNQSSP